MCMHLMAAFVYKMLIYVYLCLYQMDKEGRFLARGVLQAFRPNTSPIILLTAIAGLVFRRIGVGDFV